MDFGTAFEMIKIGGGMRLPHWKPDVVIKVQHPDKHSKMTAPYLYVESRNGKVPWVVTQVELFRNDWLYVGPITTETVDWRFASGNNRKDFENFIDQLHEHDLLRRDVKFKSFNGFEFEDNQYFIRSTRDVPVAALNKETIKGENK